MPTKKKNQPRPEIKQAAEKLVLLSRLANVEVNHTIIAARVKLLEQTVNEFLDLMVSELEKSIGSNFAAPFKAHLKTLAERYDAVAKPAEAVGPAKPPITGEPK